MTIRFPRRPADGGSISLETAILAPVLLGFLLLMVAAGRVGAAETTVDAAARNAARAASLERTAEQAQASGRRIAEQTLADQGLHCAGLHVTVPTGGYTAPLGSGASVTVTVTCDVALADLALPGLPGTRPVHGSFTSALDSYRGR